MRKVLVCTLVAALILCTSLFVTGCGESGPDYSGTWNATTIVYQGIEMDVNVSIEGGATLTLNEDGTGTFEVLDTTSDVAWETTDTGISATIGSSTFDFPVSEEGVMTMPNWYTGMDINFEKAE